MELMLGWILLGAVFLILWSVIRLAGGEREEPRANCGIDGCSGSAKGRSRP
jgi:hypothetical protein